MSKLWVLVKLNFRVLLNAMRLGSGRKAKASGMGALLLLVGISLYISGVYSFMFGSVLAPAGLLDYLIPLIGIMGCIISLLMTLFAASGFVFGGKDSDILLALPVSAFSVMLSKILALYLESLIFCVMFLGGAGVAYIYYGGAFSALFVLRLVLATVFLPLLSTLICIVLAYLLAWVTAHSPKKNMVSSIISLVFFGLIFVTSMKVNNIGALLIASSEEFESLLGGWLLPFGLMRDGVLINWLPLLYFCLICLVPFLIVVWIMSSKYKSILSKLKSRSVKNDYKLGSVKSTGKLNALFKKELRRYFGTTIYLMNTSVGMLILLGGSIYACIARNSAMPVIAQMGGLDTILPLILLALGFILSMTDTTCVSISLEGKTFWILKEAPLPAEDIFKAKAMVNLLVTWPPILISLTALSIFYGIPAFSAVAIIIVCMTFSLWVSLFGLIVNLNHPRMDAVNDTVVVKQSVSALIGYFGGLVPVVAAVVLYNLTKSFVGFPALCLLTAALLVFICTRMWKWLKTRGAEKLLSL